jgi:hypothetical protein
MRLQARGENNVRAEKVSGDKKNFFSLLALHYLVGNSILFKVG